MSAITEAAAPALEGSRRAVLRPVLISAGLLLAVGAGTLGALAYMTRSQVVPGVKAGSVDLGGLTRAEARARIDAFYAARLARPVTIAAGGRTVVVSPASLGIAVDA